MVIKSYYILNLHNPNLSSILDDENAISATHDILHGVPSILEKLVVGLLIDMVALVDRGSLMI